MSEGPRLILGDCLEVMAEIEGGSVDLIAADLPYGVTNCRWDQVISLGPLWTHYRRVLKPNGVVVLTATQPFTSMLVTSNPKWFRYSLVWDKVTASGFLNANKMPLRSHEDILVFGEGPGTYNPQKVARTAEELKRFAKSDKYVQSLSSNVYGKMDFVSWPTRANRAMRHPVSVIRINGLSGKHVERGLHPTQKPVALMEYLIRTYSNPGEMVLDNAMGSGTTGLACLNTGRDFIGIEKDADIFATASRRLESAASSTPLFPAATGGN